MGNIAASGRLLKRVALDEGIPSLAAGDVHVWYVAGKDIDDPAILRQGASRLTAVEAARAASFARREDRHRFIVGRWMLRRLLSAYPPAISDGITFAIDRHGRPELAGPNPSLIHFNLSHTDGLVACAFTAGSEIGIDAERIRASRLDMEVARNYFSIAACRDIVDAPGSLQAERFLEYWVLTEACAKAHGAGLLAPAAGSFALENADRSRIHFTPSRASDPTAWSFWLAEPAVDYRIAVALAGKPSGPPLVRRLLPEGSCDAQCRTVAASETSGPT